MEITSLVRVVVSFLIVIFFLLSSLYFIKKKSGFMVSESERLKVLDKILIDNQNKIILISIDTKEILIIISVTQIDHIELE
jgi:flagellar biogenesis protein FliO